MPIWRSPGLIVLVVASVYALVVTYPVVFQFGTSIYGYPGDATGTVAIYQWWSYALHHGLNIFDNTVWGAPFGAGWESVPFSVLPVMLMAPLSALVGGAAAYNIEILTSFPLTAWTTYLVARRLGCSPVAAAFSGLAFAFVPYHLEKAQGHAGQTHMEFFSGMLLFLLRWRQGGSRWNLVAAGALAGLTLWDDYYFAFIAAFLVATFFVVSVLYKRELGRHALALVVVGLVTLVFVPATILVAERPSSGSLTGAVSAQSAEFHQSAVQIEIYSSRPWEFVLPYHDNPLVPSAIVRYEVAHLHGSNFTENELFIGYVVMLLATVAVLVLRARFEVVLLLAVGVVGAAVSLPPGLHFHGITVPTPSLYLNPIFPIFRVYARFGILVILGAALLAGLGFTWMQAKMGPRRAALLALPFLLTAIEFNNLPPPHVTQLYPAPAEYQWLATQPQGILVEYPLQAGTIQAEEIQTRQYTLYQGVHGHPIFNGGSTASRSTLYAPYLEPYYLPGAAQLMKQLGIAYVFVHRSDYVRDGFQLPQDVPGLTYVQTLDGVDIYRVT